MPFIIVRRTFLMTLVDPQHPQQQGAFTIQQVLTPAATFTVTENGALILRDRAKEPIQAIPHGGWFSCDPISKEEFDAIVAENMKAAQRVKLTDVTKQTGGDCGLDHDAMTAECWNKGIQAACPECGIVFGPAGKDRE